MVTPGEAVVVEQIHDGDPEFLRYLADNGITPGAVLTVAKPPVAGVLQVGAGKEHTVPISVHAAADIRVKRKEV